MIPFTDFCVHRALFFDDDNIFLGSIKIKYTDKVFLYKDRIFNFKPKDSTFFKLHYIFRKSKFYMYNINNPDPINFNFNKQPLFNPIIYKEILQTDLIKKLNSISKPNILNILLQPRFIIIGLIILILVYYFLSGHSVNDLINFISGKT